MAYPEDSWTVKIRRGRTWGPVDLVFEDNGLPIDVSGDTFELVGETLSRVPSLTIPSSGFTIVNGPLGQVRINEMTPEQTALLVAALGKYELIWHPAVGEKRTFAEGSLVILNGVQVP